MRLRLAFPLLTCLLSLVCSTPIVHAQYPLPPKINAVGYLLLDMQSGQVLAEKNADQRLPPASLTKIMTAYIVFQSLQQGSLKPDDRVKISKKAWRTPGSRMFIEVNSHVSVDDLLRGLVIQSGNDAAVALAEHIGGDEANFVQLMNTEAARLGMKNTHFTNSTGLPEKGHFSTAQDLAKVTIATIQQFPVLYQLYAEKSFTYNKIKQPNRNNLLWRDTSVDGVKTGHTQEAGYCLIASAVRKNMRLISVLMGAKNKAQRLNESQALLNHGFRFYRTHQIYQANDIVLQPRVWYGATQQLDAGPTKALNVTVPEGQYQQLKSEISLDTQLQAPIAQGQRIGTITVRLAEQTLRQVPLVALHAIPVGNLWRQTVDRALQLLE
jgi:D-alanyl-D-alanine carboxypeptidase (penicillin-binding protein 5/6)